MNFRAVFFGMVAVSAVALACATNKAEPPDGITATSGGAEAGNGLGADIESGSGQYDPSAPAAFAPRQATIAEISAWQSMASMVNAFATATLNSAGTIATGAASPTPTPSAAPSVTPPASPTPTPAACAAAPAPALDADADGYPDTLETVTMNACLLESGLGSVAATGSWTLVDTSTGNPSFAFQRTANLGVTEGTASGSIQATTTASQAGANEYVIQQNATLMVADGTSTLTHSISWTLDYAPATAWGPKLAPVAGTVSVAGIWNFGFNNQSANSVVSTVTPLTLDPACATHITAGAINATFLSNNGTHVLAVTWTGCGARAVTVDGATAQ